MSGIAEELEEEGSGAVPSNSECESDSELIADAHPESRWWNPCCLARCCGAHGHRHAGYPVSDVEPKDRFNLVYFCMLMAGAGFLFPWSSYITAADYFIFLYKSDFPQVTEAIPMTYLITTLLSSTFNMATVEYLPVHARITFGYVMFSISLLFVPLLDIGIDNCSISTHVSFYLTLLSIVVVGLGSGVQQSSYYGLAGMLPRRYAQAVMAGESVAGLVVSINRIITKAAFRSERVGAIAFFVLSLLFILVCVGCHCFIRASPFIRYHTARCRGRRGQLRTSEHEGDDDSVPLAPLSTVADEQKLISNGSGEGREITSARTKCFSAIRVRLLVIRQIWKLIVAIFVCYVVTLMLFPGLISEVQYNPIGDWTPVLLVAVFNLTDFIAKWLALIPVRWPPAGLMVCSIVRIVLIPLLLLCVSPSPANPVLSHGVLAAAVVFTFALGLSNGYFGSLPMINVSQLVDNPRHKELAGTIMVWFLLLGLTLGSVLAYALTPLTRLAECTNCTSTAAVFQCSHGNGTFG